jgi:hypothetical protein
VLTRQESYSGASFISASQQLLGESYHPMLATLQASGANTNRTDLPRAIILPELKQQQRGGATPDPSPQQQQSVQQQQLGNQFGAIGCKVPVSPPPPSVVGWADSSPLLSASLMSQPPPPTNSLLSAASGLSIMQQLQAERRQREEEFRRSAAGSQWPGFGVEPDPVACPSANLTPVGFGANYYESLWDSPQSAGAAAAVPSSSRRLPASEGLWGTIGPNVWPSTVLQSAADPGYGSMETNSSHQLRNNQQRMQYHQMQQQQQQLRGGVGEDGNLLRFDPLALSSIWGEGAVAAASEAKRGEEGKHGGSATWSSTLFTNKDL